ncbi:hypothetical protein GE061_004230 [Apolygus lucorum]|uniref:CCHC-type domain-containing protein n=1 Tax=Apolygus lucorum TaxID=248454 RepID=A0A8S9X2L3_APOLU|nr:hypothetical protein GE061_004230 [Apolygus lucorum]
MLGASLKGPALTLLTELGPDMTYYDLVDALEVRFGNRNQTTQNLALLQTRAQGRNEDLKSFHQAIKDLARRAWPYARGGAAEDTAIFHFARGLRDCRLCELVLGASPKTMARALEEAVRLEAVLQVARPDRAQRGEVIQGEIGSREEEIQGLQANMEDQRNREGYRHKIVCWRCDKPGHVAYSCPERPRKSSGNERRSN